MENWLARLSVTRPRQYLLVCLCCLAAGMGLAMVPIATACTGRYEGMTAPQIARTLAWSLPLIPVSVALGAFFSRRQLRVVHAWLTGRREGRSVAAVTAAAHALPARLLVGTAAAACVTSEPAGITMTLSQLHRLHPGDFLLLTVGGLFFAVWGLVAAWIWLELCFRPVLAALSNADQTAELPVRRLRLGVVARLWIALGAAFMVGSVYAGTLSANAGEGVDGLGKLLLIALGVSAGFGAVLVPLCSSLLLGPVRALIQGTRRVGQGSLDVHLAVTGHDELAELTASFNTMVAGLQERADLRTTNLELIGELQASRERLVAAEDSARRRVERDLHDGAQQRLVTARLKLALLRRHLAAGDDCDPIIATLDANLESALNELRELAHGIFPAQLDDDGLRGALHEVAARAAIPTTLVCTGASRYRPELETAVYFSCLEALQNAAKYAGPEATATITIRDQADGLHFEIADDGVGFAPGSLQYGSGLHNIADRIGAVGGSVDVQSSPGAGTRVRGFVPGHLRSSAPAPVATLGTKAELPAQRLPVDEPRGLAGGQAVGQDGNAYLGR